MKLQILVVFLVLFQILDLQGLVSILLVPGLTTSLDLKQMALLAYYAVLVLSVLLLLSGKSFPRFALALYAGAVFMAISIVPQIMANMPYGLGIWNVLALFTILTPLAAGYLLSKEMH